jgi:hypothetical protein
LVIRKQLGLQPSAKEPDILNASPAYIRAAAILSIALSLISLSVSAYVYLELPHPDQVQHLGRWGEVIEPVEQFLFSLPDFRSW